MREIEGIDEVLRELKPHWDEIHEHFNQENERFKALLTHDPDVLGKILKCHLIVEHYLDRFLMEKFGLEHVDEARLTFFQKAKLLPISGTAASFVRPGIIKLNSIRNRFGHELRAEIDVHDLDPINELLDVAYQKTEFEGAIERIEAFTTLACTWLIVAPPHLEEVFVKAFAHVRGHEL